MGCGPSAERPLLTATGLKFHKPGVSGLPVDVTFRVQNPNPKPLDIQRFSYDVFVNDHSIGRGFVPEALLLDAFKERQMTSRFNIN
jgi:LEA14-like dessication related protein